MAWKHRKEITLLTLLLVTTVAINLTFIMILEVSETGTFQERALRVLKGHNQLDVLNAKVLKIDLSRGSIDASTNLKKDSSIGSASVSKSTKPAISKLFPTKPKPTTASSNTKTIIYKSAKGDIPLTVDYAKGVIRVDGREVPIIVDGDIKVENPSTKGVDAWVQIPYNRFDIFVDSVFYGANQAALDDLFNKFERRYEMMEQITGWSSEEFYGTKLKIYVDQQGSSCVSGWSVPGEAHISFTTFFSNPSACRNEYVENGNLLFDNPGELGDKWSYVGGMLHESLHPINPFPIYDRRWLTEGFSEYYMFNILANYDGNGFTDINQETADYYIYNANFSTVIGRWGYYTTHDYMDKAGRDIQTSSGYDITAWMFSMMRDNHNLYWNKFYMLLENNEEVLQQTFSLKSLSLYYTDTHIIDLFGRASGLDFETQTKPIWRYDGPSGPGWGVRNWEDLGFYADLTPVLSFSDSNVYIGENVDLIASVYNNGDTDALSVSVRFYNGANLLGEQFVSIPANSNLLVTHPGFTMPEGNYSIGIRIDEDNVKVESDETNNNDLQNLDFQYASCGDLDNSGAIDILDVVNIVNVAFRGQSVGDPAWVWNVNGDAQGAIDIIDVVKIVNVAFRGANAETELSCDGPTAFSLTSQDAAELSEILEGYGVNANLIKYVDSILN